MWFASLVFAIINFVCWFNRHADGIDKLKSALKSVEDEEAFKKRIEAQLCQAYAKVTPSMFDFLG